MESVILTAKDLELLFTTSLSIVTSIDLFNNNPLDKIGLMGQLESLDVSKNILSSIIPSSISTLESLSILNLSYNNLIGKIPSQMQTFTNLSNISNPELCGESLQNKCMEGHSTINGRVIEEDMHEDDEYGGIWYFISLAPGFVFGFWGFLGAVMIKRSTRIKYILHINRIIGRIKPL
ncbi:hypothetical protein ZIOFF_047912 [Zingiber officinale]|uniref:Uncharacterized protein n=1 Tax=Zingiber officinale TaxID=94328 RepID=A0A8J5FPW3_ZINOF|nr:hypothetical protein ZIOFF_047912 [Zingiber officinale]